MKIIKIMAGLGNQMFQWVFGYALSQKNNDNVLYDLSWFDEINQIKEDLIDGNVAKRIYELECFNINTKLATSDEIRGCTNPYHLPNFIINRKMFRKCRLINNKVFERPENIYNSEYLHLEGNKYYIGYFQCEKYFKDFRNDILQSFVLKIPLNEQSQQILEKINSCNSVSLHVRRGDYLNLQGIFEICSLKYYNQAIEYIANKVENPHFFLFSDDIEWVKENLKINYSCTVVDCNKKGCFDMELMRNCKHNIIANSSFSWWGAWLNNNPNKIVIAPKTWFSDGRKTDIVCKDWIKI